VALGRALTYRERYPDVNVGIAAMQERNRVASYDLMFEINIPLQQDSRRAKEREAEHMLDAARSRREATLNQIKAELAESLAALHAARRVEELASMSLLPQAELTLQSALAGYETGKVDFAAVLDAQRQIRKAREDLVRAKVLQEMRRADIERALGEEL
jgi:outer membrane protein TolC